MFTEVLTATSATSKYLGAELANDIRDGRLLFDMHDSQLALQRSNDGQPLIPHW